MNQFLKNVGVSMLIGGIGGAVYFSCIFNTQPPDTLPPYRVIHAQGIRRIEFLMPDTSTQPRLWEQQSKGLNGSVGTAVIGAILLASGFMARVNFGAIEDREGFPPE